MCTIVTIQNHQFIIELTKRPMTNNLMYMNDGVTLLSFDLLLKKKLCFNLKMQTLCFICTSNSSGTTTTTKKTVLIEMRAGVP